MTFSQLLVTAQEQDDGGNLLRSTEHTFHGGPISAASFAPLAFPGWREGREFNVAVKDSGGSVFQNIQHAWQQRGADNKSYTPESDQVAPNDPRITQTSTTLGSVSAVRTFGYSEDEHNNVKQECERDFGSGTATRCVDRLFKTDYAATPVHLRGLVLSESITRFLPGPQALESQVSYEYDVQSGGLTNYGDIVQHDPGRGTGYTTRGNVTKETRLWAESPDGSAAETTAGYDIAGNVVWVKTPKVEKETASDPDPVAPTTTFVYTDQFSDVTGKKTYAFPTTITNAEGQMQQRWYHWAAARLARYKDPNNQETVFDYSDPLDRLKFVQPSVGRTEYDYLDTSRQIVTKKRLAGTTFVTQTFEYDGLGRTRKTTLNEGGTNIVSEQKYDLLGRVHQRWNPTRGAPSELTQSSFDALDRVTQVTYPDGSVERACYTNNETLRRDAAGKWIKQVHDALGRLTTVVEDSTGSCQGIDKETGLEWQTIYTYNARDLLTNVNQGGQTRTFEYDSLGQLKQATNPENGTVQYSYDATGNLKSRAACGRSVTMKYDKLSRILSKTYTDPTNTPAVVYCYDGSRSRSACSAAPTGSNMVGRLTMVSNGVATDSFTQFDGIGRVLAHQVKMGIDTYLFGYEYNDLALKAEVYPSLRRIEYGFDGAGRVNQVTGQKSGETNRTYASGLGYAPHGALSGGVFGPLQFAATYNNRLQVSGHSWTASGQTVFQLTPSYTVGANNGNVVGQTWTRGTQSWTATFGYDEVNRLSSGNESGGWNRNFKYDRWGNGWVENATGVGLDSFTARAASNYLATGQTISDNQLRIESSTYSCGELTSIGGAGGHAYTYNGEGQVASITLNGGTVSYGYDGQGRRVRKQTTPGETRYIHDALGQLVAEYGVSETTAGGPQYLVTDPLGSTRAVVNGDGSVARCYDYLPFGEDIPGTLNGRGMCFQNVESTSMKFTGKERDKFVDGTKTGLDYFGARYFSGAQERFTSPDPSPNGVALQDPQSWNLYSYVRNRPTRFVDIGGYWATEIHAQIVTFALKGYISAGELQALVQRQFIMDEDQEPTRQYMHAMRNGKARQSSGDASELMWSFVANNLEDARANLRLDGGFSDLSLLRLGDAIHTVEDYTSPSHTTRTGELLPWFGLGIGAVSHWARESSPNRDWSAIGWAIRLTMAAYMQSNPGHASSHGLTAETFNTEASRRITQYVDWFIRSTNARLSPVQADAARQCALGNPAACNF